jgi:hypothetical protein
MSVALFSCFSRQHRNTVFVSYSAVLVYTYWEYLHGDKRKFVVSYCNISPIKVQGPSLSVRYTPHHFEIDFAGEIWGHAKTSLHLTSVSKRGSCYIDQPYDGRQEEGAQ